MSNATYDKLKWIAQIFLPALGTLWFTVAQIYHLPMATEILGTIVAVDAFLGALLSLSTKKYDDRGEKYDGTAYISRNEDGHARANLVLKNYENPAEVVNQDQLLFKVKEL